MQKITKKLIDHTKATGKDVFVWDSELRGFGLRVKSTGVKSFIVQYRNDLRESRRGTIGKYGALTADSARKRAKIILGEVAAGGDPFAKKKADQEAPTVAEFAERYLREHAAPHKRPRSVEEDRRNLTLHVLPAIGRKKMAAVTRDDIAKLNRSMHDTPTAANRVLSLLSTMFQLAEDWGVRPEYSKPTRRIRRFKEVARERFLSPDEIGQLGVSLSNAERAKTAPPGAIAAIRLLLFTGARKSEILDLTWDQVDMETASLHLPESKTGKKTIHLAAPALEVLDGIKRKPGNDFVITGKKAGAKFIGLQRVWSRIRKDAKLEGVRLHDLRHSFASVAVGMQEGLPLIRKLLGHAQIQTTDRYSHLRNDAVKAAAERVGVALAGMVNGATGEVVDHPARVRK